MRRACWPAVLVGLVAGAAGMPGAENPVHWTIAPVREKVLSAGSRVAIQLGAQIDSGWHLYGLDQEEGGPAPTEISLAAQDSLSLLSVEGSKAVELLDPNFNKRVALYVGRAEFKVLLAISPDTAGGVQKGMLQVRYQCCKETMCLPPRDADVEFRLSITAKR